MEYTLLSDDALGDTKAELEGQCTGVLFQSCVMMMRMRSHCRSVKPSQSWPRCTATHPGHELYLTYLVILIFSVSFYHISKFVDVFILVCIL